VDEATAYNHDGMATRDHYVSRFFLSNFTDPSSAFHSQPWIWVTDLSAGNPRKRAPKNIGWARDLFAGPGGLADRERRLEEYIAGQIEGPAAPALRSFCDIAIGQPKEIPPELCRYMSWLAARSITMKTLYESWIADLEPLEYTVFAEEPPDGLMSVAPAPERAHTMEHPEAGVRTDVSADEIETLRLQGWRWLLTKQDFLEMVHIQAYYFQARFFPRLVWRVLHAPEGTWFVTCDRPVAWGVDGSWEVPPSALRHSRAELIVPISRSRALYATNRSGALIEPVSPRRVNRVMATVAHHWIAGPQRRVVAESFRDRAT